MSNYFYRSKINKINNSGTTLSMMCKQTTVVLTTENTVLLDAICLSKIQSFLNSFNIIKFLFKIS